MILPARTMIRGQLAEWTEDILAKWRERVAPLFKEGETCSDANYFTPRPWRNEYDRGSDKEGFVYTVYPRRDVAFKEWKP